MSASIPSVTVVVVSWNVAKILSACLESIFATHYPSLQVIVVDNASSDDSVKVAKSFPVQIISNSRNLGFPVAVNQGLKFAPADYYLILNPDCLLPSNFFRQMLDLMQTRSDVGVIGPQLLNPDGSVQASAYHEPTISRYLRQYWLGAPGLTDKYIPSGSQPVTVDILVGACLMFSRSVLSQVGYFTERVFMYYEDFDYCRRLRRAGFTVIYNPTVSVIHYHGQSASQTSPAPYRYFLETLIYPLRLIFRVPNRLASSRRYINEAKIIYHGWLPQVIITFIIWSSRKFARRVV